MDEIETLSQRNAAEVIIELTDAPSRSRKLSERFLCRSTLGDVQAGSIKSTEYLAQYLRLISIRLSRIKFIYDSLKELSDMGFGVNGLIVSDGGFLNLRINIDAILVDQTGRMFLDIDVVNFTKREDRAAIKEEVDKIRSAFIYTFWDRCSIDLMALKAYQDDYEVLARLFDKSELASVIERIKEYTYNVLELLYDIDFNTWYKAVLRTNDFIMTQDLLALEDRVSSILMELESYLRWRQKVEMRQNAEIVVREAGKLKNGVYKAAEYTA